MKIKKLILLLMAAVLTIGVMGCFSTQEVKGTVSKIDGNKLTILEDMGNEKTVEVKDLEVLKEIKVGDRILIKDDKVIKENM